MNAFNNYVSHPTIPCLLVVDRTTIHEHQLLRSVASDRQVLVPSVASIVAASHPRHKARDKSLELVVVIGGKSVIPVAFRRKGELKTLHVRLRFLRRVLRGRLAVAQQTLRLRFCLGKEKRRAELTQRVGDLRSKDHSHALFDCVVCLHGRRRTERRGR